MKIKGAIFDLDGVITNTVPLHFKAWEKMFEEYGYSFSMQDYLSRVDGRPRLEGAAAILTGLSAEKIKEAGDKKQSYYLELLEKDSVEVFQSSITLIHKLKDRGVRLAAASSSKNAVRILKKIGLFDVFEINVSGADFEKGKPDPEIFLKAAKRLKLEPGECVVFEDARSGIEAARRGGFYCVGIDRHHDPQALIDADKVVGDLSELNVEDIMNLPEESKHAG